MAVHKIIILLINKSEKLPLCPFFNAEIVLSIEIVAQLFRICYYAFDPVNIRAYTTYIVSFYFFLTTFPLGVLSTTLILIHWNHATSFESYIDKYRVVFFVVIGLLFLFSLVGFLLLLIYFDPIIVCIVATAIILFFTLILSIYVFYTAPRVIRFVRKTLRNEKEIIAIEKKTRIIFLSGALTILWFLPCIIFFTPYRGTPLLWFGLFFSWFFISGFISLAQISVFQPSLEDTTVTSPRPK